MRVHSSFRTDNEFAGIRSNFGLRDCSKRHPRPPPHHTRCGTRGSTPDVHVLLALKNSSIDRDLIDAGGPGPAIQAQLKAIGSTLSVKETNQKSSSLLPFDWEMFRQGQRFSQIGEAVKTLRSKRPSSRIESWRAPRLRRLGRMSPTRNG